MRILIIGFIAFSGWSGVSTCIFVCKKRGLCYDTITFPMGADSHKDVIANDTLRMPLSTNKAVITVNL